MSSQDTKQTLIDDFKMFKSLHDVAKLDKFIQRINAYIHKKPDEELGYMALALHATKEEVVSSDFLKCKDVAAPIFAWLKAKQIWSYLDCLILHIVFCHAETYKLANTLAEKAVEILQSTYSHENKCKAVIYSIYGNMTYRLLRAKYYDLKENATTAMQEEVGKLFRHYMQLVSTAARKSNFQAYLIVLEIREGLFHDDSEGIIYGLQALKKLGSREWYKTTCDEIMEYISMLSEVPSSLQNLYTGRNIRHYRKLRGLTAPQLAEAVDTNTGVIYDCEAGRRGMSRARLRNIAKVLKVDIATLDGFEGDNHIQQPPNPIMEELLAVMEKLDDENQKHILTFAELHKKYIKRVRR